MILQFTVGNFRSFAEPTTLSFVATKGGEHSEHVQQVPGLGHSVLPLVGLYGGNASGKSNMIQAMQVMAELVLNSYDHDKATGGLRYSPFKLDDVHPSKPTLFDCEFVLDGKRFRYGFEYLADRVIREWLHAWPSGVRQVWFERNVEDPDGWYFGPGWKGMRRGVAAETQGTSLFLTITAKRNHPDASRIREVFSRIKRGRALVEGTVAYVKSPLLEETNREMLLHLLSASDLGVNNFRIVNARKRILDDLQGVPGSDKLTDRMDRDGDPQEFHLAHRGAEGREYWLEPHEESDGTRVLLHHLHGILPVLESGGLLLMDELDRALHPMMIPKILSWFTHPETNPKGAQLVFSSHQTTLLELLRRDEVYLVDKDDGGRSTLTPLSAYRTLKRDDIERLYWEGRVGGIPRLDRLEREIRSVRVAS